MWNAQTGKKIYTGAYNGLSGDSQARYCSLDYTGILAAVGHDDCTLKVMKAHTCIIISIYIVMTEFILEIITSGLHVI